MLKFYAQGYFSWAVLNEKDKIVRYAPNPSKNLILNQGLDGIAIRSWADSFVACAIGTGGSSPSMSQIQLDSESKRTNTYLDLADANSSFIEADEFVLKRTFVFTKESSTQNYSEAGFAWASSGPTLFSRVLLPSVSVGSGERLIIQYELRVKLSPVLPVALTTPISKMGSSGYFQYQLVGLKGVNSAGQSYDFDAGEGCNEPSVAAKGFLASNSSPLQTFGSCVDRSSGTIFEKDTSSSSYISGAYYLVKTLSIAKNEAKSNLWRCIGLGATSGSSFSKSGLVYLSNAIFSKTKGILNVGFTFSWNRRSKQNFSSLFYWQDEEELFLRKQNPILSYFGISND